MPSPSRADESGGNCRSVEVPNGRWDFTVGERGMRERNRLWVSLQALFLAPQPVGFYSEYAGKVLSGNLYSVNSQTVSQLWLTGGLKIRSLTPQNTEVPGTRVWNSFREEALADILPVTLWQELWGACVPWPMSWGLRCASWSDSASQGNGKMPRNCSTASSSQTLRWAPSPCAQHGGGLCPCWNRSQCWHRGPSLVSPLSERPFREPPSVGNSLCLPRKSWLQTKSSPVGSQT